LQNRFVSFQFAITFYQIFDFPSEATVTRSLITHIQLKTLVINENQNLKAISYTIKLNQHPSAICAPLYKRKSFKHWKFNQPFEIKVQNPCNPWEWRPQNYSGTGRDPSQVV